MDAAGLANQNGLQIRNEQRRIWHEVMAFVTAAFGSLLQLMSQSANSSPVHGHKAAIQVFILAILAYAITRAGFLIQEYPNYEKLIFRLNILFGTLAVASLVLILVPVLGAVLSTVWVCWFTKEVIWMYQEYLHDHVRRIAISVYESLKAYILGDRQQNGGDNNI